MASEALPKLVWGRGQGVFLILTRLEIARIVFKPRTAPRILEIIVHSVTASQMAQLQTMNKDWMPGGKNTSFEMPLCQNERAPVLISTEFCNRKSATIFFYDLWKYCPVPSRLFVRKGAGGGGGLSSSHLTAPGCGQPTYLVCMPPPVHTLEGTTTVSTGSSRGAGCTAAHFLLGESADRKELPRRVV